MPQWSHRSYPQGSPTPERLFVLCIDIRMDESIVVLVGGSSPEEKESKMFLKISHTRYISFDGKFEIVNIGDGLWSVSKQNDNDKFFSLYFDHPFNGALEAMAELRKVGA
jgi:NDP-sugar pyrophosphorylase family protein